MEGDNRSTQPAPDTGLATQAPAIQVANTYPQNQAMDTAPGMPTQTAAPVQVPSPQAPAQSYSTMAPTAAAESPAPSSNVGTPPATTANYTATISNTPAVSAVPKDGKAAAQSDFPMPLPSQAQVHGAPVRQYLNENLSPFLLEVTKYVAAHRPQKPLEFVAEYFMEKSRQIEGNK